MNDNEIKFIQTKTGISQADELNTIFTYYSRKEWTVGRLHFSYTRVRVFATLKARIKYISYNTFKRSLNALGVNVYLSN